MIVFFSRSSEIQSLTTSSPSFSQCDYYRKHVRMIWNTISSESNVGIVVLTGFTAVPVKYNSRKLLWLECSAHSRTGKFPGLSAVSVKPVRSYHLQEACELLFHTLVMFLTVSVTSASSSCWILPDSWKITRAHHGRASSFRKMCVQRGPDGKSNSACLW